MISDLKPKREYDSDNSFSFIISLTIPECVDRLEKPPFTPSISASPSAQTVSASSWKRLDRISAPVMIQNHLRPIEKYLAD